MSDSYHKKSIQIGLLCVKMGTEQSQLCYHGVVRKFTRLIRYIISKGSIQQPKDQHLQEVPMHWKCLYHGSYRTCESGKMVKSIIVRRAYVHFVKKYQSPYFTSLSAKEGVQAVKIRGLYLETMLRQYITFFLTWMRVLVKSLEKYQDICYGLAVWYGSKLIIENGYCGNMFSFSQS